MSMDFETRREAQDGGHSSRETHPTRAAVHDMPRKGRGGQWRSDALRADASPTIRRKAGASANARAEPTEAARSPNQDLGSESHPAREAQPVSADASGPVAVLRQLWRRRQRWHQAEKSLTLQCSAICRAAADGSKTEAGKMLKRIEDGSADPADLEAMIATAPLLAARGVIRTERLATEKVLAKLARSLPVYPWAKAVYGFGDLGLAAIVGEAGDVGPYRTVSGLWKRMGLAVIGGERQRMKTGEAALDHGYSPRRRSVMWNIGGGLIGGMGKGPRLLVGEAIGDRPDLTPYQRLFVERIRYEAERDPDMRREPTTCPKTGKPRESFSAHAANRAKRYVEKRFLRDLYSAWRAASGPAATIQGAPPATPIPADAGAERQRLCETHGNHALGTFPRPGGAAGQTSTEAQRPDAGRDFQDAAE